MTTTHVIEKHLKLWCACVQLRERLEEEMRMDLSKYKAFIDEEMLLILGQLDSPSQVFDFLYLGSEWNASNLDELKHNGCACKN